MKQLEDHEVPAIVTHLRTLSHTARAQRADRNRRAWQVVNGELDFSKKTAGQSCLVLPDLARGLEQVSAKIERELTHSNAWFSIEDFDDVPRALVDGPGLQKLTLHHLRHLHTPGYLVSGARTVESVFSDAVKLGIVEGEVTLKCAPVTTTRRVVTAVVDVVPKEGSVPSYALGAKTLEKRDVTTVALDIQAVPYEDAFPDPSGSDSWFIHETTQKISDLKANPDYDQEAIERLVAKTASQEQESAKRARGGLDEPIHQTPGTVRVMEFWGDLIDKDGTLRARNVLCTVAEGELLRAPVDNPLWWGSFPFVRGTLRRNPLGTVHPSFADLAIEAYLAENDLFNMLLDAAKANVWGVKQFRPEMLENEAELADGIPPGFVARLRQSAGAGKFMERVDDQVEASHASMMLNKLGQAREVGLATPDLQLGQLPDREVLATEIISTTEGSATLFDALTGRLEDQVVEPLVRLAVYSLLQFLPVDDLSIVRTLGPERAALLAELAPEERFDLLAQGAAVRVTGLREMTGRVTELRKVTTALQLLGTNPALAQVFDQRFSMERLLEFTLRALGVDIAALEKGESEGPELDPALLDAQAGGGGNLGSGVEPAPAEVAGNLTGENGRVL